MEEKCGSVSPEVQMKKMVSLWWDEQELEKNQSLFQPGGRFYDEKKD